MRKFIIAFIIGFVTAGIAGAIGIYYFSREAGQTLQLLQANRESQRIIKSQLEQLRGINSENEETVRRLTESLQQSDDRISDLTEETERLRGFISASTESSDDITDATNGIREILDSIAVKTDN
jgi:methyl-accepting chemotaxis protein